MKNRNGKRVIHKMLLNLILLRTLECSTSLRNIFYIFLRKFWEVPKQDVNI